MSLFVPIPPVNLLQINSPPTTPVRSAGSLPYQLHTVLVVGALSGPAGEACGHKMIGSREYQGPQIKPGLGQGQILMAPQNLRLPIGVDSLTGEKEECEVQGVPRLNYHQLHGQAAVSSSAAHRSSSHWQAWGCQGYFLTAHFNLILETVLSKSRSGF
ncbi:hypothetical protein Tco_0819388 [Tanacetum coccineum]|uniref:Uncharacterized protein n=1 Tax=Tanacetum coccineum TaxID=301880 RepID=A0ABQ5A850_9ASTR